MRRGATVSDRQGFVRQPSGPVHRSRSVASPESAHRAPANPHTRWCSLVKDAMNTHALVTPTPIELEFARRPRRGYLVQRPGAGGPSTAFGRSVHAFQRLLLGNPIPSAAEAAERLGKIPALAVFSSDALSSVAYATEEIMKVLLL